MHALLDSKMEVGTAVAYRKIFSRILDYVFDEIMNHSSQKGENRVFSSPFLPFSISILFTKDNKGHSKH